MLTFHRSSGRSASMGVGRSSTGGAGSCLAPLRLALSIHDVMTPSDTEGAFNALTTTQQSYFVPSTSTVSSRRTEVLALESNTGNPRSKPDKGRLNKLR